MSKKTKIILVLNILVICLGAFFLIQQLFFAEKPDQQLIIKAFTLFLIYSVGVGRFVFSQLRKKQIILSNQYLPFFSQAFNNDKKSYKKLLSVGNYFNKGAYDKAYTLTESLKKNCSTVYDRAGVSMAEVLCLYAKKNYNAAFSVIEKLLSEYPNHSTAQTLRILLEQRLGQEVNTMNSINKLENLASNAKKNYAVHVFKSIYHYNRKEYEDAKLSAKKAYSIDNASLLAVLLYTNTSLIQMGYDPDDNNNSSKRSSKPTKETEQQLSVFLI